MVPKESLSFSTPPRSILATTPKMGNPQKWSIPRSLLQVPENGLGAKTGRGPEDDLKTHWRKLRNPSNAPPRGRPEAVLLENANLAKLNTPEISPSPL